jgi:hypothetical protein
VVKWRLKQFFEYHFHPHNQGTEENFILSPLNQLTLAASPRIFYCIMQLPLVILETMAKMAS